MSDAQSASDPAVLSLWTRLRFTPMRDVMRGHVSGRLDLKGKVSRARLPESLDEKVLELVKATRLTKLERIDVAEELIAHFQDGLETGATSTELAQSFGDVRRAGRLIRRAKKRLRPAWWQAMTYSVKAFGLLVALTFGLYLFSALTFYFSESSPSIDYRLLINEEAMAVPQADRAWPHYLSALVGMPDLPSFKGLSNRAPQPGEAGWDSTNAYLVEQTDRLLLIRQAAGMSGLGYLPGYELTPKEQELWPTIEYSERDIEDGGMFAILLPHLSEMRGLARILKPDALRAAAIGDAETALADIEAMLGITRHVRETPFIISDLVSLSTLTLAIETVGILLTDYPDLFDDRQLRVLAHGFTPFDNATMRVRFHGERMGFLDILQRLYSDDGSGNGKLTASGFRILQNLMGMSSKQVSNLEFAFGPVLRTVMADRAEMTEQFDRLMDTTEAYASTPPWEHESIDVESQIEKWNASPYLKMKYLPLVTLMPALEQCAHRSERVIMQRDTMLTGIAMELHKRRHGAWPESLEAMVPDLLPQMPIDRFTGDPLLYIIGENGPILYSRGGDRDDDGGKKNPRSQQLYLENYHADQTRHDGDWVLWPVYVEPFLVFSKAVSANE